MASSVYQLVAAAKKYYLPVVGYFIIIFQIRYRNGFLISSLFRGEKKLNSRKLKFIPAKTNECIKNILCIIKYVDL